MLDDTVKTHGITEISIANNWVDRAVEEITINGYTLVDSGLDSLQLEYLRKRIDQIYDYQVQQLGSQDALHAIKDANIARALCAYDRAFIEVALLPQIQNVCSAILGKQFILMSQNGIINPAKEQHYQFSWHRDLNYQHYVSSKPLAISALVCVDPFNDYTGGTHVLPATHRVEAFPSREFVIANQKLIEAPAGTIILFDCMVFHRTGLNKSVDPRRAINHIITSPMIRQQYDLENLVDMTGLTDQQRTFFGEGFGMPASPYQWRVNKLNKVKQ